MNLEKIDNCKLEVLPIEYSILFKLTKYSKISITSIIAYKKTDLDQIQKTEFFSNELLICEKDWCTNVLKDICNEEYIFDSSKSRVLVKKTIFIFYKKLINIKENTIGYSKNDKGIDGICLGYPKCATTWFYNIAKQVPLFDVGSKKELEYFNSMAYLKGKNWYENEFDNDTEKFSIDISVNYLGENFRAISRILEYQKEIKKELKFVIFVRKPSSRFVSYIKFRILKGRGFYNIDKYLESYNVYSNFIKSSEYQEDIEKLLKVGIKPSNIFVVFQEDIQENASGVFENILDYFLDDKIDNNLLKNLNFNKRYNKGKSIRFFKLYKLVYTIDSYLFFITQKSRLLERIRILVFNLLKQFFVTSSKNDIDIKVDNKQLRVLDQKYLELNSYCKKNAIRTSSRR